MLGPVQKVGVMMFIGTLSAVMFAFAIVCLVECVSRLFPRAIKSAYAAAAVLLSLVCIGSAFVCVALMHSHGRLTINWIVAISLLALYVLVRSVIVHAKSKSEGMNNPQ